MNRLTAIKLLARLTATLALLVAGPALTAEMGGMHQRPMDPPGMPGAPGGMRPARPSPQLPGTQMPGTQLPGSQPRNPRPDSSATSITFRGTSYVVSGGQWYERRGTDLVAVDAPAGVLVRELPKGYAMRWIGGAPYFYADGLYYVWRERLRLYEIMRSAPSEETPPAHEHAPPP